MDTITLKIKDDMFIFDGIEYEIVDKDKVVDGSNIYEYVTHNHPIIKRVLHSDKYFIHITPTNEIYCIGEHDGSRFTKIYGYLKVTQ